MNRRARILHPAYSPNPTISILQRSPASKARFLERPQPAQSLPKGKYLSVTPVLESLAFLRYNADTQRSEIQMK